jgi:hypothetical protein
MRGVLEWERACYAGEPQKNRVYELLLSGWAATVDRINVRFERRGIDSSTSYSHIEMCLETGEGSSEAGEGSSEAGEASSEAEKKTKDAAEGERTEEGQGGGQQGSDESTGRRKSA